MTNNGRRQGIYWLLTIPASDYDAPDSLPDSMSYIGGQLESGAATGYEHYQILVAFKSKVSLPAVKKFFGSTCHGELSRSSAALDYCFKDDTSVPGSRFEYGCLNFNKRNTTYPTKLETGLGENLDFSQVRKDRGSPGFDSHTVLQLPTTN